MMYRSLTNRFLRRFIVEEIVPRIIDNIDFYKKDAEKLRAFILDEPEIHLHPEWQLLFAELIVLLQKEFDVHILLNSHSPYFLNAIEVYSAKYGIDDRCKYYLASSEKLLLCR